MEAVVQGDAGQEADDHEVVGQEAVDQDAVGREAVGQDAVGHEAVGDGFARHEGFGLGAVGHKGQEGVGGDPEGADQVNVGSGAGGLGVIGNDTGKLNGEVGLGGTLPDGVGRSQEFHGTFHDCELPVGVDADQVLTGGPLLNWPH